ncbi:Family S53 protease-like protein [Mycena venus]|uniref:Family S53 protease-like protein n=1 Tax=Mycena venus TaxID=2733690 RepID=A0A8H6XN11_9AGAR|nr:Family S53 protease-like protein [Mycena venus]
MPPSATFTLLTMDKGTNPQDPDQAGVETNLDIQYTGGVATGVPLQFLSIGKFDFPAAILDTTTFLDGIENPPTVMTTSYGSAEDFFRQSMATSKNLQRLHGAWCMWDIRILRLRRLWSARKCSNNTFIPVFPASCPFVTSVGSTQGFTPEKAVNFTGEFSNFFPAAYYQTEAVAGFLETIPDDFSGIFNTTGCGFPDASTQGWNFEMVADGEVLLKGGTSASSPTFASIIALINDRLISVRKPVLDFINPWVYILGGGQLLAQIIVWKRGIPLWLDTLQQYLGGLNTFSRVLTAVLDPVSPT